MAQDKAMAKPRSANSLLLFFRWLFPFQRLLKLLQTRQKRWLVKMISSQ
jgi:hypothetical protein